MWRRSTGARRGRTYTRIVCRAYRRVPFYREQWAEAGTPSPVSAPVPASTVAAAGDRFMPLSAPDDPIPQLHGGELFDALMLTERYSPSDELFDVREGLLDHTTIGPRGSGRYRVVLSSDARVAPYDGEKLRDTTLSAYRSAANAVLLADDDQLAGLGIDPTASGSPDRRVLRRGDLTQLPSIDILMDTELGYLGARRQSCGRFHVDENRLDVRELNGVLVFTRLDRENPTLLHIAPTGGSAVGLDRCASHDGLVLTAEGRA